MRQTEREGGGRERERHEGKGGVGGGDGGAVGTISPFDTVLGCALSVESYWRRWLCCQSSVGPGWRQGRGCEQVVDWAPPPL